MNYRGLLTIMLALMLAACAPRATQPTDRRIITVRADKPIGDCYRFWGVANFNHPSEILAPGAKARIADAQAAGLKPLPAAGCFEGSPTRLYGPAGADIFKQNAARYAAMSVTPKTREETLPATSGHLLLDLDMPAHCVRLIRVDQSR